MIFLSLLAPIPVGQLHREGVLLLAVVALLLAAGQARRASASGRLWLAGVIGGPALSLLALELLGGAGPVHRAAPLPAPLWGALEGLASGVLVAAVGGLVGCTSWIDGGGGDGAEAEARRGSPPSFRARPVRAVAGVLAAAAVVQFSLGIGQRAERGLLLGHVLLGIAVILPLTVRLAIAAALVSPVRRGVRSLALSVAAVVALQAVLGVGLLLPGAALGVGFWTKVAHHWLGGLLVALLAATFTAARAVPGENDRSGR